MKIRTVQEMDGREWSRMRTQLWPNTQDQHRAEIAEFFTGCSVDIEHALVIERAHAGLAGFIELNIRSFAEGSRKRGVPYVEAWYVDADLRGKGWGRKLMQAAEQWSRERGFTELGSDTECVNTASIAAHQALGFAEIERVVCFLKQLP